MPDLNFQSKAEKDHKMDNRRKSLKNLFYNALGQVVTIAFGLILPRLFIVSYGSEVNGLLNSLSQFLVYLSLFEAGIGTASLQALYRPVAEDDWDGINGVMAATDHFYKRAGTLYLAGLLLLSVGYPLVVKSSLSFLTVAGTVFFSGIGNVVLFFLQGKYRFLLQADGKSYITINLETVAKILTSMAKVVLIRLGVNIVLILAVSFLINCLQAAYILWYVRGYPRLRLDVPPNYQAVSQRNFVLIHQISTLIFSNTDVLILTVVCGLRVVSVYSLFRLVTSHLETLLDILINSIRFALGQNYQTNKALYTRRIDLAESYFSAALYAIFSVALFLFLPFMRLYTAGVTDVNYIDPWLALLSVLVSLLHKSRLCMNDTISFAGHFKQTLPYSVLESAINLTASFAAVYFLGVYGVLLGTVAALVYRTNQIILYANHKLLERSAKKTYAIYAVNIALFFLTQFLFNRIFDPLAIDSYPRFIAAGALCTLISFPLFAGAQTLLFPDCRRLAGAVLRRLTGRGADSGRLGL